MLVGPLVFLLLYILIKLIMIIPYFLVSGLTSIGAKNKKKPPFNRLLGGAVGLVIGAVGVFVLSVPLFGYLELGGTVITSVAQSETATSEATAFEFYNTEYVQPALESPVAQLTGKLGGNALFRNLTSGKWQGEELELESELVIFADIVNSVQVLSGKSIEEFSDTETDAIEALADDIGRSSLLSVICSGILNRASTSWQNGETFLGIPKPEMGENGDIIVGGFLKVFSTSDASNIGADMGSFADMFALVVKYDLISLMDGDGNEGDFVNLMDSSGFLSEAKHVIDANPRLIPVNDAIHDAGMRLLIAELGLPEDYRESCGELMNDMANVIHSVPTNGDGSINEEGLAEDLKELLIVEHEINVSESTVVLVAAGVADHFTAQELASLDTDEVIDKLIERFGSVEGAIEAANGANGRRS